MNMEEYIHHKREFFNNIGGEDGGIMRTVVNDHKKLVFYIGIFSMVILLGGLSAILFFQEHEPALSTVNDKIAYDKQMRNYSLPIKSEISWNRGHDPIRITFVGDLMMDWSVKETMDTKGVDYPFLYVKEDLHKAHIAVANLETAVTTRDSSYKDTNQRYNFKSKPEHLQGLVNAGFDLVSLANNHALDYGEEGLMDSMEALKYYGLDYIGAGKTLEEAFQSQTYKIYGKKINIMAATRFVPAAEWYTFHSNTKAGVAGAYDLDLLIDQVKKQKEGCDYLILYIHWGIERTDRPAQYQKYYVEKLVEAGVDAIIGHHPHWLQGFEYFEGVPVAYSLGNFLFPDYVTGNTAETGLLTLTIHESKMTMGFKPYYIYKDQITPLSKEEENRILKKLENISFDVKIEGYEIIHQR
ncbi:poly-gamma-glutamate synthesis protein (capsule biosynthesis protein) [Evansella vedderi]|uniref:Poly-gamma-glutamate synthesis protein (Capsule biosynthesis protein) n=1 Tax=Evansella vedderi TaxID=38282 RepID=A0ABT9ZYK7_9BACI|nr:CapA family protein [Evansella vedderi]MDQ0255776.1 poly-gamma-glutamate synthesis protein (capsule biosynthesis protein) [Evansella vedderi]